MCAVILCLLLRRRRCAEQLGECIGYYLVDLLAVGLGNQHRGGICCSSEGSMLEGGSLGGTKARSQNDNFCGRKPY
jgi:hypothetical protein